MRRKIIDDYCLSYLKAIYNIHQIGAAVDVLKDALSQDS